MADTTSANALYGGMYELSFTTNEKSVDTEEPQKIVSENIAVGVDWLVCPHEVYVGVYKNTETEGAGESVKIPLTDVKEILRLAHFFEQAADLLRTAAKKGPHCVCNVSPGEEEIFVP